MAMESGKPTYPCPIAATRTFPSFRRNPLWQHSAQDVPKALSDLDGLVFRPAWAGRCSDLLRDRGFTFEDRQFCGGDLQ